tara:strand:+ start:525 stop:821 length:297 start_codon:yes stop_codon:yes gene_type:complete
MSSIAEVIGWKHNHQSGMCCQENSDGVMEITEFPNGIPSQALQDTWKSEYDTYVLANAYKSKRAEEYPSIADQLDDIYHNGIDAWKATIKVTKDKYPK